MLVVKTRADIAKEIRRLRAEQRRAVIPSTADEIGRDIDDLLDAWAPAALTGEADA